MKLALRALGALFALLLLAVAAFATNVAIGLHTVPREAGTIAGLGLEAPVQITRDARDVPHIRATNEHDMFFAQGYVEGSDRLFQLDIIRRYVYGQLSEVLGSPLLSTDEDSRVVPVAALVEQQWKNLDKQQQRMLQAFSDGINAAMATQPEPPEFRLLMYRPAPWRPQDALAVGFATVMDLTDTWDDVAARSGNPPLTDPCYEAPVTEGIDRLAPVTAACTLGRKYAAARAPERDPIGSNEWAAGAARTITARALLANDPHLRLGIPGVWYLVDLAAPGYHAAGATLAGTPGVILGHNDAIAWGATNGTVACLSVFDSPVPPANDSNWHVETFHVRFGGSVTRRYYRTPKAFGTTVLRGRFVLVRWNAYERPVSPLLAFDQLDRAHTLEAGIAALRTYAGPPQNFELASTDGRAAYALAGSIPDDPVWARSIHPASDLAKSYAAIPFDRLPHVAPSRDAVVWTSNNKMYGPGYPYRLSPEFAPPYRAYRVAELLRARKRYDVNYFASMQMDTLSLAERELARRVVNAEPASKDPAVERALRMLATWDGRMSPNSKAATIAAGYRHAVDVARNLSLVQLLAQPNAPGSPATSMFDDFIRANAAPQDWSVAGQVTVKHSLAALGIGFLNGSTFAGDGDSFTVHVQNDGFSQSFRAVWDIGNWDAGGITIPQGESGWPGSAHYTDEAADWVAGRLVTLPYSNVAVGRAAVTRQTLRP